MCGMSLKICVGMNEIMEQNLWNILYSKLFFSATTNQFRPQPPRSRALVFQPVMFSICMYPDTQAILKAVSRLYLPILPVIYPYSYWFVQVIYFNGN